MRTSTHMWIGVLLLCGALGVFLPGTALAATGDISAELDPPRVGLGESASLSVTVTGSSEARPLLPSVDGVRFDFAGSSQRMQSINGRVSHSTTWHYAVRAREIGTHAIPPIAAEVGGRRVASDPLALEVVAGATAPVGSSSPANAPSRASASSYEGARPFLRVATAKDSPYVGELVPIRIEAWFPEGVGGSLDSLPRPQGNAFTLQHAEEEGERDRRRHDGRIWTVITWSAAVSAVKEGTHDLTLAMDATLQVRDARARRPAASRRSRPGSSLFDDPFFSDVFGDDLLGSMFAPTREVELTLESDALPVAVRSLPVDGRPEGWRGAVGSFVLEADVSTHRVAVGDPLTLETVVRGLGNFDRVTAPVLQAGDAWKTYEADASFTAAEGTGFVGEKRFEQAIVPKDGAVDAVPPVVFSYFDPDEETYVTLHTEPVPVTIDASVAAQPRAAPDTSAPLDAASPYRIRAGTPVILLPAFQGLVAASFLALIAGVVLLRRRQILERDPTRARRRDADRVVRRALGDADHAVAAGDTTAFFAATRRALQARLGEQWEGTAESLTLRDVRHKWPDAPEPVVAVLEASDVVTYARRTLTSGELQTWQRSVRDALTLLENDR